MKNKTILQYLIPFVVALLSFFSVVTTSLAQPSIVISGAVKQTITLAIEDLNGMQSVSVRLNEVKADGNYDGVFKYTGVPLRTILEMAVIEKKKDAGFNKLNDLAIVVKSRWGGSSVLSWGEVFYRNPGEFILALSATPINAHHDCSACHFDPELYEGRLAKLRRPIGFPRLVVAGDFYTDRSLEGVDRIEIIDLKPAAAKAKAGKALFSPSFNISMAGKAIGQGINDLSTYPHEKVVTTGVGDGMGYHGLKSFSGVPLTVLLEKAGIETDPKTVFLVTSPDGYRSILSYGELFYTLQGRRILIADGVGNFTLRKDGRFIMVVPDDQAADRWVKAVDGIEILRVK